MNLLHKYSKFQFTKAHPTLVHIHQYYFSKQQHPLKSRQTIYQDRDADTLNPLLKSLSENPTFAEIQDTNPIKRHQRIDTIAHKRKNRSLHNVSQNDTFSSILNARSVDEIRTGLQQITQRKTPTKRIMDILESIANDNNDEQPSEPDKSDKEENYHHFKTVRNAYYHAIKMCGYLKEFEEGISIFEETKQSPNLICARIFAAAIWLQMEYEFSVESLNKCYEWMDEMQTIYNITPSAIVYAELIKSATSLRQTKRAADLINSLMKNEALYINSKQCIKAIMNYYAKTKQIEKCIVFMRQIGTEAVDDVLYSSIMSGMALIIRDGDTSMISAAEKLFEQSFSVLGRTPKQSVFGALINCYAHVPDTRSCIDVIKGMISNDNWPNPNAYIFASCLKSLTQHYNTPLSYEEGWGYVDDILSMMGDWKGDQDFEPNYGLLFTLCGGTFVNCSNLDKLYMFYDDLINNGLKLSPSGANSLLMAGIDHYKFVILNDPDNKEEIKKDLIKYIDWALLQYKKNDLSLTKYQNDKLQSKLSEIV